MKTIVSYLKFNGMTLLILSSLTVLPLGLIMTFFPNSFPDIHLLIFAFLVVFKTPVFRGKDVK